MGAKTKTVGGGSATGVANDWNNFLSGGLNNPQGFGGAPQQQSMPDFGGGFIGQAKEAVWNKMNTNPGSTQNTQGQAGMFGNAINQALSGNIGDTSNINQWQSAMNAMNQGLQNGPVNTGQHQAGQVAANVRPGMVGSRNVDINSWINQLGNFDVMGQVQGANQNISGASQLQGINPQLMQQLTQMINAPQHQLNSPGMNTPEGQAAQQLMGLQDQRNIADLRERFSGSPGLSRGTGAAVSEAQYRAEANPRQALAIADINRQWEQLGMQNAGMNAQNMFQAAGLNQAGAAAGIGAGQAQNQLQQGNDQINQNASMQGANNILQALGLQSNNIQGAGQLALGQGTANQQAALQAAMANQSAGLQAQGMNANINSQNADRMLQAFGINSGNQLQAQQLFQGLMGQAGQLGLGAGGLQMDMLNSQQAARQNMINTLFGGYMQSNGLGTPQAQTVQTPGVAGQIIGGLSGLAGAAAPFLGAGGIMGMFGGGGQPQNTAVGNGAGMGLMW